MSETSLELNVAEVAVLNSCIERVVELAENSGAFDAAEMRALWNLEAAIEKTDSVAFAENYAEQLAEMKKSLVS